MDIVGKGVTQGGTYAGNAVAAAAAKATLDIMSTQDVHEYIEMLGIRLQNGLKAIFKKAGIPCLISSMPAIFSVSFGIDSNLDAREWGKADTELYKRFSAKAFENGILIDEDPREPFCLSYSHTEKDIDDTLEVFEKIVNTL